MPGFWPDVRLALRGLRKDWRFNSLAVLTLALGIGASTTIFSVVQGVLLAPYPYRDVDRVVNVQVRDLSRAQGTGRLFFQVPEFLDLKEQAQCLEEVIAGTGEDVLHSTDEGTELWGGAAVTVNNFSFLGLPAALGRTLEAGDDKPGAPPVFVMNHKLWVRRFGQDPTIVGRTYVLNGVPTTLVGIMPARFSKLGAELYRPAVLDRADPEVNRRWFMFQGRLKPGVTLEQAETEIGAILQRLSKVYPDNYPPRFAVRVVRLLDSTLGPFRKTIYILAAAVGLLLLIACGNVANMLLTRAAAREREMAVRASLGASRLRLIRQLLAESLLLSLLGAGLGAVCAFFGIRALVAAMPPYLIPGEAVLRLNPVVLLFSLGVAVVTALLCGLAPAMQTVRRDLVEPLKDGAKGSSAAFARRRLTRALVVAEVAFSLVLLAGAGLLARSFVKLQTVELGLDPTNVVHVRLPLPQSKFPTREAKTRFLGQVVSRLQSQPGVVAVSAASALPPYGGIRSDVEIAGRTHTDRWTTTVQLVGEGYFPVLRLELVRGRPLEAAEVQDGRKVAVVNQTFARRYFGDDDPIGQRFELKELATTREFPVADPTFDIVGVFADAKNQGPQDPPQPEVFVPYTVTGAFNRGVLVRTAGDPASMLNTVRREVWAVDRHIALSMLQTMEQSLDEYSYTRPRFNLVILSVFAVVGLVLVTLGVFTVIAYTVSRQTHEIGIRMALGADRAAVLAMVLRMGIGMIGLGVGIGLAATFALTRVLSNQLFDVAPHDPLTLLGVAALLTASGLLACYIPARRATRVDPMVALRYE